MIVIYGEGREKKVSRVPHAYRLATVENSYCWFSYLVWFKRRLNVKMESGSDLKQDLRMSFQTVATVVSVPLCIREQVLRVSSVRPFLPYRKSHLRMPSEHQPSKGSHTGLFTLGHLLLRSKLDKGAERGDAQDVGNAFGCCTGCFIPSVNYQHQVFSAIHGAILKPFDMVIVHMGRFDIMYGNPLQLIKNPS